MHPLTTRVHTALNSLGFFADIQELPTSTRTALEAAQSVGCDIGQIVKSLVFIFSKSQIPILLLVSGQNRVNENLVGRALEGEIRKATAQEVQEFTGFPIGGVPPIGHLQPISTYMDEDLFHYDLVWAAAGTPNSVFPVSPHRLRELTDAKVISVK